MSTYHELTGLMHGHGIIVDAAKEANLDPGTIRALEAALAIHLDNLLDLYTEEIQLEALAKQTTADHFNALLAYYDVPPSRYTDTTSRIRKILQEMGT